jgi:glycosyltransferase involved in cell wall biosynthesis
VTCRDSGGPAELVTDDVDGFVCDPSPDALAAALRRLQEDRTRAERMGQAARGAAARLDWKLTVARLTEV